MPRSNSKLEFWRGVLDEAKGSPFRAAEIAGVKYKTALLWRSRIMGPQWRKRGTVKLLTVDNVEELKAARLAKISPAVMAARFGVGESTLKKIVQIYGLPRIRKPRTPKRPSKVW